MILWSLAFALVARTFQNDRIDILRPARGDQPHVPAKVRRRSVLLQKLLEGFRSGGAAKEWVGVPRCSLALHVTIDSR